MFFDIDALKKWFLQEQRDLPWRQDRTPYRVWVSEMMLQQTQVSVVIPYFERWMKRFPTIQALSEASLDEVLKLWEGLGYYSRARYLHEGARYLMKTHGGHFPESIEGMEKIKGLGPYTMGAIRSFAFHHKTAAVDGNVLRVLSRYFFIEEDLSKQSTVKQIKQIAHDLLPEEQSWIINEALIELGATLCTRTPHCKACPLKKNCQAHLKGSAHLLPVKSAKVKIENLYRAVALISCRNRFLIGRVEKGQIMSDLHEFPYFDIQAGEISIKEMTSQIKKKFALKVDYKQSLEEVNHSFTRYRVNLKPHLFHCSDIPKVEGYDWLTLEQMKKFAFSSGHRRILGSLNALEAF